MSNQQELTPFPTRKWNSEQTVSGALLRRSALGNLIYNVQNRGLGYDMAVKIHVLAITSFGAKIPINIFQHLQLQLQAPLCNILSVQT